MFSWEAQMQAIGSNFVEKVIVKADDIEDAYIASLKQAGDEFEIYSITKIW